MSEIIEQNMTYLKEDGELSIFEKKSVPTNLNKNIKPGFYIVGERPTMMGSRPCIEVMEEPNYPESTRLLSERYFDGDYISNFFSEEVQSFHNFLSIKHKLGILLYGIPGTGKTSAAYDFSKRLIKEKDAVVITVNDKDDYSFVDNFVSRFRKFSDQMIVIIFDECEYYLNNYDGYFKRKLDSNESLENVLTIFITNKYDYIPTSISERPSRIKFAKEIKGITDKNLISKIIYDFTTPLNGTDFESTNSYLDLAIDSILESHPTPTIDEVKNGYVDYMLNVLCAKV